MDSNVRTRRLDNGLLVVVDERTAVPIAAVNLWYDVGARHERADQKGLAHLFEHLMFQGSANVPSGEFSETLEAVGARSNATTSIDRTNYFETVPVHALEVALWLEADRMATLRDALSQREFDAQRAVVKNERLQTIVNPPYGEAFGHVLEALFPAGHPYAIGPIGEMDHLDAASLDDLRAFFDLHYAPNNAVISVVGDVDPDRTLDLVEKYFGGIPRGADVPSLPVAQLPPLSESRHRLVDSNVPNRALYRGWIAPALTSEAAEPFAIATGILGGGPDSRIGAKLIRELQWAVHARVDLVPFAQGNSLLIAEVIMADGVSIDAVNEVIDGCIRSLATEGPSDIEFETELAQSERAIAESIATVDGRADSLSEQAIYFGDPLRADTALDRVRAVTPAQVQNVAREWLLGAGSANVEYQPRQVEDELHTLISVGEGI